VADIKCSRERIQGNCASEPSSRDLGLAAPKLRSRRPGQCILITDVGLLEVEQDLWLANLYIRLKTTDDTKNEFVVDSHSHLNCFGKDCNLWLTSVTLQGVLTNAVTYDAMDVKGGQVYASGALFLQFLLF
jgi:hypothetical protein